MATSSQLRAERQRYYTFREQVTQFAAKLLESYTMYNSAHDKLKEAYKIDGEAGDSGILKSSYDSLKESYNLLNNTTIPAINNKIDNLSHQIRVTEAKEEEEAEKKQEEEAAKRRAASDYVV